MRKTVLGIAAAALLAAGSFSTTAEARSGWYGGYHHGYHHRSDRWIGPAIAASFALPLIAAASSGYGGYGYGYPSYGYGGYPAYGFGGFGYPGYAYAGFPGFFGGFGGYGYPGFGYWGGHRHRHVIVHRRVHRSR